MKKIINAVFAKNEVELDEVKIFLADNNIIYEYFINENTNEKEVRVDLECLTDKQLETIFGSKYGDGLESIIKDYVYLIFWG